MPNTIDISSIEDWDELDDYEQAELVAAIRKKGGNIIGLDPKLLSQLSRLGGYPELPDIRTPGVEKQNVYGPTGVTPVLQLGPAQKAAQQDISKIAANAPRSLNPMDWITSGGKSPIPALVEGGANFLAGAKDELLQGKPGPWQQRLLAALARGGLNVAAGGAMNAATGREPEAGSAHNLSAFVPGLAGAKGIGLNALSAGTAQGIDTSQRGSTIDAVIAAGIKDPKRRDVALENRLLEEKQNLSPATAGVGAAALSGGIGGALKGVQAATRAGMAAPAAREELATELYKRRYAPPSAKGGFDTLRKNSELVAGITPGEKRKFIEYKSEDFDTKLKNLDDSLSAKMSVLSGREAKELADIKNKTSVLDNKYSNDLSVLAQQREQELAKIPQTTMTEPIRAKISEVNNKFDIMQQKLTNAYNTKRNSLRTLTDFEPVRQQLKTTYQSRKNTILAAKKRMDEIAASGFDIKAMPKTVWNEAKQLIADNEDAAYQRVVDPIFSAKSYSDLPAAAKQFNQTVTNVATLAGKDRAAVLKGVRNAFVTRLFQDDDVMKAGQIVNPDSLRYRVESIGPDMFNQIFSDSPSTKSQASGAYDAFKTVIDLAEKGSRTNLTHDVKVFLTKNGPIWLRGSKTGGFLDRVANRITDFPLNTDKSSPGTHSKGAMAALGATGLISGKAAAAYAGLEIAEYTWDTFFDKFAKKNSRLMPILRSLSEPSQNYSATSIDRAIQTMFDAADTKQKRERLGENWADGAAQLK